MLGKVIFFVGMILTLFMAESLLYVLLYLRAMQPLFHIAMLQVKIPAITLTVISNMIPLVLFDVLENPWEFGIDSIWSFPEIP